jgi:hypothetical protein
VEGEFPLLPLPGARATACIHSDLPAESARRDPVVAA